MASVFKKKGKGPWIIRWFDAGGRLHEKSSRTTDKRAADRIASQIEADVALRREGVIDPRLDQFAQADVRPLQEHIDAYIVHLEHGRRSPRTIADAKAHMAWIVEHCKAKRITDLSLDAAERALKILHAEGRAARTINHRGGSVRAFLEWCVDTNRMGSNPLRHLPHLDEESDRRRRRRALTIEEVGRLLAVAEPRGRKLWYLLALYAGLRLSDLKRLRWADLDLLRNVVTIRQGKAKRVDEVPLHEALKVELARQRPAHVLPTAAVFPSVPTNETRRKDFRRAKIAEVDEDGLFADLHSLRVTLGTMLARQGVTPQVAQRVMRHSRYSTTLRFYTQLGLVDTAAAVASLPAPDVAQASPHHSPHQSQHEGGQPRAN